MFFRLASRPAVPDRAGGRRMLGAAVAAGAILIGTVVWGMALPADTVPAKPVAAVPALAFTSNGGSDTVIQVAAAMAPRSMTAAPPPRPGRSAALATEASTDAAPEPTVTPPTKPLAVARPAKSAEAGPATASTATLAVLKAPRPPTRPALKATNHAPASVQRAIANESSPANIRQAAIRRGLELGSTNLIGVLDATTGRQALLRTSSGQILKVTRGDAVEGWRVTDIHRDSIRLNKAGQSRTLSLIVR